MCIRLFDEYASKEIPTQLNTILENNIISFQTLGFPHITYSLTWIFFANGSFYKHMIQTKIKSHHASHHFITFDHQNHITSCGLRGVHRTVITREESSWERPSQAWRGMKTWSGPLRPWFVPLRRAEFTPQTIGPSQACEEPSQTWNGSWPELDSLRPGMTHSCM